MVVGDCAHANLVIADAKQPSPMHPIQFVARALGINDGRNIEKFFWKSLRTRSSVRLEQQLCRGAQVSSHELEWRMLGACRGLDAGIFYPDNDDEAIVATQVCAQCGVQRACLEFALVRREKAGVWGGATERERRRILRQRRRTA